MHNIYNNAGLSTSNIGEGFCNLSKHDRTEIFYYFTYQRFPPDVGGKYGCAPFCYMLCNTMTFPL